MILWLFLVAFILLLVIWNLDSWFLMRLGLPYLYIVHRKKPIKDVLKTHVFRSIVLPVDLDFLGHMNNARYLREADIARAHFLAQYQMLEELRALGGHMMMNSSCTRYRKELNVFQRFDIHTRILGWDDSNLFVEQRFIRPSDGFVVCVMVARFNMKGPTPAILMEHLAGKKVESPDLPEEVLHWLKYNELSSQKMRAESNHQANNKVH
ncbi:hypothetical protein lerEdw1_014442 [Lerista edwardsae]|nr:hypothetical protein lerEdw1_014442 [Lerista edwardsae]